MSDRLTEIRQMREHDRQQDVGHSILDYHRAVDWLVAEVERQAELIRGPLSQEISEAREERDEAMAASRLRADEADRLRTKVEHLRSLAYPHDSKVSYRAQLETERILHEEARAEVVRLRDEVERLRALLAEPTLEEANRITRHILRKPLASLNMDDIIRAIVADLRQQAGGVYEPGTATMPRVVESLGEVDVSGLLRERAGGGE